MRLRRRSSLSCEGGPPQQTRVLDRNTPACRVLAPAAAGVGTRQAGVLQGAGDRRGRSGAGWAWVSRRWSMPARTRPVPSRPDDGAAGAGTCARWLGSPGQRLRCRPSRVVAVRAGASPGGPGSARAAPVRARLGRLSPSLLASPEPSRRPVPGCAIARGRSTGPCRDACRSRRGPRASRPRGPRGCAASAAAGRWPSSARRGRCRPTARWSRSPAGR